MSPIFPYKAKNSKLEDVSGAVEAQSMDEAIKKIQKEGLLILLIEEGKADGSSFKPIVNKRHSFVSDMKENITEWCEERNGFFRLPLLIWFAYLLIRYLGNPDYQSIFGNLNLGIHELGHIVFSFDGRFLAVSGGTMLQLLAPFFLALNFLRQSDYFATVLCSGWLSTNFFNVATYAGDAQAMVLPLVTIGGATPDVSHDWNYMLTQMGILSFDSAVAFFFRACGFLSMGFCLVFGGWMIFLMIKNPSKLKKRPAKV
ncbi:MAG: hypothetical protein P9M07_05525 [Candidatus Aceula meridiana]|nr:hypothetical protein [Candidatus Aceula meridiana]